MVSPGYSNKLSRIIHVLIVTGWVLLPLSHFKYLPELGTTRPLSALPFGLAFAAILLSEFTRAGLPFSPGGIWAYFRARFVQDPGWRILRWWAALIALGTVSAALVLFYGSFPQALNRLFGYFLIFLFLSIALVSVRTYPIQTIARWVAIGYFPVFLFGLVEALAILGQPWAYSIVMGVRNSLVVSYPWYSRLTLLTTEPSFVGFQLILLVLLLPFVQEALLRVGLLGLIVLSLIFSQSATFFVLVVVFAGATLLFSLKPPLRAGLAAAGGIAGISAWLVYSLSPAIRESLLNLAQPLRIHRLEVLGVTSAVRWSYLLNLVYVLIETRGLGLGIGQYGLFWKEIFMRHIDYQALDVYGEISGALASSEYMRPYSVVFGIGSDLGILGMLLFSGFLIQVFRLARTSLARALVAASFFALLSAYPIVTPHVWLALGLIGAVGQGAILPEQAAPARSPASAQVGALRSSLPYKGNG